MTPMARTAEELTKARDGANMLAGDLRSALAAATPVEALLLLPLIKRAHELSQDIRELQSARASDDS